jgi:hypothetical protein
MGTHTTNCVVAEAVARGLAAAEERLASARRYLAPAVSGTRRVR